MRKLIASFALLFTIAISTTAPPVEEKPDDGLGPRVLAIETSAPAVLTGCNGNGPVLSPTQKDAIKNIAADRIACAASMLGRPMNEILAKCGASLMADDLKNLKDAIFGMKEGAAELGAKIPDAPAPGTYLPPPDAGAPSR